MALIATVVFCAGFLFFYRDGNIFGIQYINSKDIIYARESESMEDLVQIEVNSKDFDVVVRVNKSVDTLIGAMRNNIFGYALKSKAQAKFELSYNKESKTAVFSSTEPRGWLNKKDSCIEIAIPQAWAERGCSLKVNSSKGDIIIGGEYNWHVGELQINTSKGDVDLKNLTLKGQLDVILGKGKLFVDSDCVTLNEVDTKISLGSGIVNFSKINVEKFILRTIEVDSITKGQIWIKRAEELVTNGNVNGGGRIEVDSIGFVDFTSLDTDIYINKITKSLDGQNNPISSRIKLTGQGDAVVNSANCNLEVNGYNGKIEIKTVTGTAALSSKDGNIIVSEALKLVSAVSEYGNIRINFSDSALNYQDTTINDANKNRAVIITTKSGHVRVDGLHNGNVVATGAGSVALNYDRVVGENNINVVSGVVNIVVPNPTDTTPVNGCAFNLSIRSEVNADIKVGVAGSIGGVDFDSSGSHEFTNIYNSSASTFNNLSVTSTTGRIKIRSADLINF